MEQRRREGRRRIGTSEQIGKKLLPPRWEGVFLLGQTSRGDRQAGRNMNIQVGWDWD
jgi:hypothetical protein